MANQTSGRLRRLIVAIVSLVALALFFAVGCSTKSDTAKAEAGSCIKINKASATDADTEPVDCTSDEAVYKIASTNATKTDCPSPGYTTYTETSGSDTVAYLCLYENLKEGKCYATESTNTFSPIDCADPNAKVKVSKRIDGQEDETLCAEDDVQYLTFPEPKLTYCLSAPA